MKAILVVLVLAFAALSQSAEIGVARILGTVNDPNVNGYAWFITLPTATWVYVNVGYITHNPNSTHGIHVHQFGDITSVDGTSAGEHYIGAGIATHACETVSPRHEGDLGNWIASNGSIVQIKTLDLLTLSGNTSIIGKAVTIHIQTDDCVTQPTGNSSSRIAYGVIGVANPAYLPAEILAAANLTATTLNTANSSDSTVTKAIASLSSISGSSVTGTVTFTSDVNGVVTVVGQFTGLSATQAYGFHIHIFGDLNSTNGEAASSHFNPFNNPHGAPPNASRHEGDLGNICSYDNAGNAYYNTTFSFDTTPLVTLVGINSIIGRNVIVHSIRDTGSPTATFGTRLAQGVIGVANATITNTLTLPAAVVISTPTCDLFAPNSTVPPTTTTSSSSSSTSTITSTSKSATTGTTGPTAAPTSTPAPVVSSTTSAASSVVCGASFALIFLALLF